jgi:hypothetical protein
LSRKATRAASAGFDGEAFAAANAFDQRFRHVQVADFAAFRFDIDRAGRVKGCPGFSAGWFQTLLGRLRLAGQDAEDRAFVAGQRFEIQHLLAQRADGLQDARLGTAGGAADDR